MLGTRECQIAALNWKTGMAGRQGRVTTRGCELGLYSGGLASSKSWKRAGCEPEGFEDVLLAGGGHRALGDAAVAGLEGDQVHAVELVADVAPGVLRLVLDGADEQEREPAELDVGADAVFAVVEDRPQPQRPLQVPPAPLDLVELLVGGGQVGGGKGVVGGAEQELPVEAGLVRDGALADPELAVLGPPQQPEQGGGGAARRPARRAAAAASRLSRRSCGAGRRAGCRGLSGRGRRSGGCGR